FTAARRALFEEHAVITLSTTSDNAPARATRNDSMPARILPSSRTDTRVCRIDVDPPLRDTSADRREGACVAIHLQLSSSPRRPSRPAVVAARVRKRQVAGT